MSRAERRRKKKTLSNLVRAELIALLRREHARLHVHVDALVARGGRSVPSCLLSAILI